MSRDGRADLNRRAVLGLSALALSGAVVPAAAQESFETIDLWPGVPPGGEGLDLANRKIDFGPVPTDRHLSSIAKPILTVLRPEKPDGSALLIAPGGGYSYEAFDFEGMATADEFAARGITCFVLTYRLPYEGWTDGRDVPLQDAQRAMRLIRARGPKDFGLDTARAGVLGFSAGGHLAGSLATRSEAKVYAPVDEADDLDARPSFAALIYPVVTMLPPFAHEASCFRLLGANAPTALRAAYSVERAVTVDTPPCFLCSAADDPDVPVDNSLGLFASLRAAKVPAEMHIFEDGGHGFGLGVDGLPDMQWPELFFRWGQSRKFFRNAA